MKWKHNEVVQIIFKWTYCNLWQQPSGFNVLIWAIIMPICQWSPANANLSVEASKWDCLTKQILLTKFSNKIEKFEKIMQCSLGHTSWWELIFQKCIIYTVMGPILLKGGAFKYWFQQLFLAKHTFLHRKGSDFRWKHNTEKRRHYENE